MLTLSLEISFLNFKKVFFVWLSENKKNIFGFLGMTFALGNENIENLYSLRYHMIA